MFFSGLPETQLVGIARLAAESEVLEAKRKVEYLELSVKSVLNRCSGGRMPFEWTINPYRGCEFGCKYCYARYTHEFMELRESEAFEAKIFAKKFDPGLLREELRKVGCGEAVAIGTATDPYQPAERRFGVMRRILEVFAKERGRRVSIVTKSDLLTRDIDLLRRIARANVLHVCLTITTLDAGLARLLEPKAPTPELRLGAVRKLADAGLSVGVFPNPILPLITDREENLDAVAAAAAGAGATFFGGGLVYLKPCAQQVFFPFLEKHYPHLLGRYRERFGRSAFLTGAYPEAVKARLRKIRERHGLASAAADYRPELWEDDPQGELFPAA